MPALLFALGCAGQDGEADYPSNEVGVEGVGDHGQAARRPKGALFRDEVDATVDEGLGYFLQRVDLEPALDNGRFRGFRLVALRPTEWWEGVDLKPGDVVLRVNGMPIERDTQAYDAFVALKKARVLRVEYLRGGQQRELVFRIIARPEGPASPEPEPVPSEKPKSKDAG